MPLVLVKNVLSCLANTEPYCYRDLLLAKIKSFVEFFFLLENKNIIEILFRFSRKIYQISRSVQFFFFFSLISRKNTILKILQVKGNCRESSENSFQDGRFQNVEKFKKKKKKTRRHFATFVSDNHVDTRSNDISR